MQLSHLGLPVRDYQRSLLPAFLHAGFRAAEPAEVRTLLARLDADGVTVIERDDEEGYTSFKCLDPDGHRVEVYWEPPFSLEA